jgi:hypothetical protein
MDGQVALLLVILAGTTLLFTFEWVPADVVAIGLLVVLVLTGMLTMEEAFAGFGSSTFMLLLGLFILTAALTRTGVVDMAGRRILRFAGDTPNQMLLIIMVAAAGRFDGCRHRRLLSARGLGAGATHQSARQALAAAVSLRLDYHQLTHADQYVD